MLVTALKSRATLESFLQTDPAWHAYALADLTDPFFAETVWVAAQATPDAWPEGLVLQFNGLTPPILQAMGRPDHLPAMLAAMTLPPTAMFLGLEAHLPALTARYRPRYLDAMLRMALAAADFRPVAHREVIRLTEADLPALAELYRGAHGNAFAPYQLRQGIFYGLAVEGELVSVAGTHIVAPPVRVAALGNVFTRPQFRGQGLAQQVTSAVCTDLLAQGLTIVLNVEATNSPARHLYQKLGFKTHCPFWEGVGDLTPG